MTCPTPGKIAYPSRRAAAAKGQQAQALFRGAVQTPYKCPGCRRWHLTTRTHLQHQRREAEISAEGLKAFMREHDLSCGMLARRAEIPIDSVRSGVVRGLVPEGHLAALQGAMAGVLRERRERVA